MRRSRRDPTTWASLGHRPRREYHTARHRFEPDTLWRRLTIAYVAYMVVCFIAIVILVRGGTS